MSAPTNDESYGFHLKPGQKVCGTEYNVDENKNVLFRKHWIVPGDNGKAESCYYDHPDGDGGWKAGRGPRYERLRGPNLAEHTQKQAVSQSEDKGAFRLIRVGNLVCRPPEYVIEGLIETDSLSMFFGAPGSAKSFVAADVALCVATGSPFHGRKVKRGTVIYIAGEGHDGLTRRFSAWRIHRGIPIHDAPCYLSTRAASFLDEKSAETVAVAISEVAGESGTPPALVVVDTVARNYGSGDENNTAEMVKFVNRIDWLKSKYPGCAVLLVHHSGHSDNHRARGSMALKGALDCEFRVEKSGDLVTLVNTKMKDAPQPSPIAFKLVDVGVSEGLSSAVLVEAEAPPLIEKLPSAYTLARKSYIVAAIEGNSWRSGPSPSLHINEWRDRFYAMHTGKNIDAKRQAFNRVRRDLRNDGVISFVDDLYLWNDEKVVEFINTEMKARSGTDGI